MVESNACIKFERNLLQEKKVVACQRISWNFVSYLGNHGLWKAELQTGPKFKKKKKKEKCIENKESDCVSKKRRDTKSRYYMASTKSLAGPNNRSTIRFVDRLNGV